MKRYKVYTDGSYDPIASKDGGWAYLIVDRSSGKVYTRSGRLRNAKSSVQMEIVPIVRALDKILKDNKSSTKLDFVVYTDSQTIIDIVNGMDSTICNKKYYKCLIGLLNRDNVSFRFVKVKAHSGNTPKQAVYCDMAAKNARKKGSHLYYTSWNKSIN